MRKRWGNIFFLHSPLLFSFLERRENEIKKKISNPLSSMKKRRRKSLFNFSSRSSPKTKGERKKIRIPFSVPLFFPLWKMTKSNRFFFFSSFSKREKGAKCFRSLTHLTHHFHFNWNFLNNLSVVKRRIKKKKGRNNASDVSGALLLLALSFPFLLLLSLSLFVESPALISVVYDERSSAA